MIVGDDLIVGQNANWSKKFYYVYDGLIKCKNSGRVVDFIA